MSDAERLIRSITGPTQYSILPLALAVEQLIRFLFWERLSMDDVVLLEHVYTPVALQLGKRPRTAARAVERLANYCWDGGDPLRWDRVVGKHLRCRPTPGEIMIYLAFYAHFGVDFYQATGEGAAQVF